MSYTKSIHQPLSAQSAARNGRGGFRRYAVLALLAVFFCLSVSWAVRVRQPVSTMDIWGAYNPDERQHIAVLEYMASHRELAPYTWEFHVVVHPPFYHILGAAIYGPVWATAGRSAAIMAVRILSCLLGMATLWLIYRTGRSLVSHETSLFAAALVAFLPTFLTLSGAISNENLSTLAAAGALYLLVLGLKDRFTPRRTLALGLWIALGIGSKVSCLGLIPAALLALWWSGRRHSLAGRTVLGQAAVVLGLVVVLTGWWFVRNQIQYGDIFRRPAVDAMWNELQPGYRGSSALDAAKYAYGIASNSYKTFWAAFDAGRVTFPIGFYYLVMLFQILALTRFLYDWAAGRIRRIPLSVVAVTAVFGFCVTAIAFRYNWSHFTPAGRYYFPLLLPFGIITAAGWRQIFPRSWRNLAAAAVVLALFLLNLYAVLTLPMRAMPFT